VEVKATLESSGNNSVNATVNNKIATGLKLGGTFATGKSQKIDVTAEYKYKEQATVSSKVTFPSAATSVNTELAAVLFRRNWAFGLAALNTINSDNFAVATDKVSGAVQYNGLGFKSTGLVHQVRDNLLFEFRYFRRLNRSAVATELSYNHTLGTSYGAVGVSTTFDDGTIGKVTLGTTGLVGLSYKKRLDDTTEVILGANANSITKEYDVGFNLEVSI
jgi:hypothetical protein